MELIVLGPDFQPFDILDSFESLIWTDKYCGYGDFELTTKMSPKLLKTISYSNYFQLKGTKRVMVIEDIKNEIDVEDDILIVKGRSLESILDRRIIWQQTILSGNFQDGIFKLLNENIISPSIAERAIPNFIFEVSNDPAITSLTVDAQFLWDNLYDSIYKLCETNNLGFSLTLSDAEQLIFKLHAGTDRSYDQTDNPYVVFAPSFDNLLGSGSSESIQNLKTITLVAGEGEGTDRMTTIVGGGQGLERREMYTDASNIYQDTDEALLSDEEYLAQLAQKGNEDLIARSLVKSFEGKINSLGGNFTYGVDFFLGDIVQVVNKYGIKAKARVTELIQSQDVSGKEIYPTFTLIDEKEEESV